MAHNKSYEQRAIRPSHPRYLTRDKVDKNGVVLVKATPDINKYGFLSSGAMVRKHRKVKV